MTAEQMSPDEELKRRHQRHMQNILELRSFLLAPVSQPKWKRPADVKTANAARQPAEATGARR